MNKPTISIKYVLSWLFRAILIQISSEKHQTFSYEIYKRTSIDISQLSKGLLAIL